MPANLKPMKTEALYYDSPDMLEFEAQVLELETLKTGIRLLLDRTAFYPEGGGQPADRGTVQGIYVDDVRKTDGEIWHYLTGNPGNIIVSGATVRGIIDGDHRHDYRQQHTGQHILSAVFAALGDYPTVSVHQGEDYTSIEFAVPEIPPDVLLEGEAAANRIIGRNLPVRIHRTDSSGLEDFSLRRPSKQTENIRIVEIPGVDQAACGGLHLSATGETGLIHLLGTEKIRGNVRTLWKIGDRAYRDYRSKTESLRSLSELLSVPPDQAAQKAGEIRDQLQNGKRELLRLKERTAVCLCRELLQKETAPDAAPGTAPFTVLMEDEDPEIFRLTGTAAAELSLQPFCLLNRRGKELFWLMGAGESGSFPFERIRRELLPLIGGKGGGKPPLWQGAASAEEDTEKFIKQFRELFI